MHGMYCMYIHTYIRSVYSNGEKKKYEHIHILRMSRACVRTDIRSTPYIRSIYMVGALLAGHG